MNIKFDDLIEKTDFYAAETETGLLTNLCADFCSYKLCNNDIIKRVRFAIREELKNTSLSNSELKHNLEEAIKKQYQKYCHHLYVENDYCSVSFIGGNITNFLISIRTGFHDLISFSIQISREKSDTI